jgi:hypothetical protein
MEAEGWTASSAVGSPRLVSPCRVPRRRVCRDDAGGDLGVLIGLGRHRAERGKGASFVWVGSQR